MSEGANRLLVVDDQDDMLDFVSQVAEQHGYVIETAKDADSFRERMQSFDPTLISLDLQMPGSDGIELLRYLGRFGCKAPVLINSGMDSRVLSSAEQFGRSVGVTIAGTLQKPIMLEDLEAVLLRHRVPESQVDPKELARAVDRGQLVTHYQPKATRTAGGWRVVGVEALVRWQHPEYGMVYPDLFIGLAEKNGYIAAITDFVLQDGIRQLREWDAAGLILALSVNLSPKLVRDIEFPDRLTQLMSESGLQNSRLTLEITETAALEDPTRTIDILTRLRVKSFGLSLDDFGTGYSSLTQLYRMPFGELKIDKSLGMDLENSREAQAMVRALIDLSHNLGIKVCAEGVETARALALLEAANCDYVQGYFLGRPMAASALLAQFGGGREQVALAG